LNSRHFAAVSWLNTGRTRSDSMTCELCGAPAGTSEDCPGCQVWWVEQIQPGERVRVALPADIAPWWDETACGATWDAVIVTVNGDSLDVTTPTGEVEPVDCEFCRPSRSSAAASPAKTSPLHAFRVARARVLAFLARSPVSGRTTRGSSARSGPAGSSSKTLLPSDPTGSTGSSETLPAWGTMRNGACSALTGSVPPTSVHAYSWSPGLPVRVDPGKASPARSSSATLGWLLSTSGDAAQVEAFDGSVVTCPTAWLLPLWPTPTKRGDGNNTGGAAQFRRNGLGLNAYLRGAVHPTLSEWMMGFPPGWTAPPHVGTQLFLFVQK